MSMESGGSGQQSDSEIGCARLAAFFASRECLLSAPKADIQAKGLLEIGL